MHIYINYNWIPHRVWRHLCTGTVLNSWPLFCKLMVLWDRRAGDAGRLSGSLRSQDPSSPFCRAAFKNFRFGPVLPKELVSALCGSSLAFGAVDHVRGTALRVCVYILSPRRSLASSLQTAPCGFNAFHPSALSRPPRVTAQILPSALRGDVTQCRDGPARTFPHTRGCVQSAEGKVCPESSLFMRRSHGAPCSTFLTDRGRGHCFCDHIPICDCFPFYFIAEGSGKNNEYQTETCSPGELCPGPCNIGAGRDPRHRLA